MWRCHLRYPVIALALGFTRSTLPWAGIAAPAKRSAPATPPAPAPTEDERALALFKAKVEQFQRFLSRTPVILLKQDFSISPTGVTYNHARITLLDKRLRRAALRLPRQSVDRLPPPDLQQEKTLSCGDVVTDYGPPLGRSEYGYSTYEKAMAHISDCFKRQHSSPEEVRLTFAYQDGRWVFKDAIHTTKYKPPNTKPRCC